MNIPFIKHAKRKNYFYLILASVLLTVLLFLIVGIPRKNTTTFLDDIAILGIVSMGQLFIVIAGGIDFSLQGIYCASAIMASHIYINSVLALSEIPAICIFLIVVVAAALIGAVNGFLIAKFNINPLIVTFAMNTLLVGILYAYTGGISGRMAPPGFERIVETTIFSIPIILIFWVLLAVTVTWILKKTVSGRMLYATGKNRNSAYLSGIPVNRVTVISYAVGGAFAGLAGILACANNGYSTLSMADNVTIQTFLVVLLAGTSFLGGNGRADQTILGTLIITELTYIFRLIPIHTGLQNIILGLLLLILTMINGRKRGAFQKQFDRGVF